jgi:hypothetical protein
MGDKSQEAGCGDLDTLQLERPLVLLRHDWMPESI